MHTYPSKIYYFAHTIYWIVKFFFPSLSLYLSHKIDSFFKFKKKIQHIELFLIFYKFELVGILISFQYISFRSNFYKIEVYFLFFIYNFSLKKHSKFMNT